MLVAYIDQHRERFGVEPICTVLRAAEMQIAPSTYYAATTRPPSARAIADEQRLALMRRVHAENYGVYGVYGVRKMHAELNRRGHRIARCTVHRLMRADGLRGISRAKGPRTTVPGSGPDTRPDLLDRDFKAPTPNRVWVADITYGPHLRRLGLRRVRHRRHLPPSRGLAGVEDPAHRPRLGRPRDGVVDPSARGSGHQRRDRAQRQGVQYLAVRYTQRLAETGAVASVGSTGDSYDNALAEEFNSLFKAELVRNKGPWKSIDDLEIAVAEYIDWFNHRRLHGEIGVVPPVEFEEAHYRHNPAPTTVSASVQSLH